MDMNPTLSCPTCDGEVLAVLDTDGERVWLHWMARKCACPIGIAVSDDGEVELFEMEREQVN